MPVLRPLGDALMRGLFNQVAPDWVQIRSSPVYREAIVYALARLPERLPGPFRIPRRVLDVACGTGLATQILMESFPAADVFGVDIASSMIDRARQQVPEGQFVVGTSRSLPFDDRSFDLVMSADGVFDIDELVRVCAPGGAIVIVYTRGEGIPVRRPLEELTTAFEHAGAQCVSDRDASWVVWAHVPGVN